MAKDMEQLYNERMNRYITAMRNEKPDMIPIRPFVAEFTAKYAGYTCQDVAHDYNMAFEAAVKCAKDFDWDAVVPNMVYVWTGLTQAAGLRYYGIPGIGIPHTVGFNYIEPPEEEAFMKPDEYDALIDDPTGFLYNTWLPRVSTEVSKIGEASTTRNNLALVKSGMAMLQYFYAFGPQIARLRSECGTGSAIAGIFKAPFDIIADKMRGYLGLVSDMHTQPKKVLKACEALMPHLVNVGLNTADANKQVPIGYWMHRGCVPFFNPKQFESHYWPTLKPCIEEFWKNGHQTLFYAEGRWKHHFETFRELPDRSIVFHCDQDDIFEVHRRLHDKFAISGGKDDINIENMKVMNQVCREHGVYASGTYETPTETPPCDLPTSVQSRKKVRGMAGRAAPPVKPGVCIPWEEKLKELPEISGNKELVQKVWEDIDSLGYMYIWQCLLSF